MASKIIDVARLNALLDAGNSAVDVARMMDLVPQTVYRHRKERQDTKKRDWETADPTICKMWKAGHTSLEIATALDLSRAQTKARINRLGLYRSRGEAIIPFRDTLPPSPAMIRLAEFDAVVARALAQRTGKKEPSEGVTDSSEG